MEKVLITGKNKGYKFSGKLIKESLEPLEEALKQFKEIWESPFSEEKVKEILNQFQKNNKPTKKTKKQNFDIEELLRKLEPPTEQLENRKSIPLEDPSAVTPAPPIKLLRTESIPDLDDLDIATEPIREESPIKQEVKVKKFILKPSKVPESKIIELPDPIEPISLNEILSPKDVEEVVLEEQ